MKGLIKTDLYDLIAPNVINGDLAIEFDLTIQCINQIVAVAIELDCIDSDLIRQLFIKTNITGTKRTYLFHSKIHKNWYIRFQPKLKSNDVLTVLPSIKIKSLFTSIKIYPKSYLIAYAYDLQSGYSTEQEF